MERLTVEAVIPKTDALFELVLNRGAAEFEPGNCVAIFNHARESRPYSISSGTQEPVLRFLIRHVPNGAVSSWLAARQPGDEVRVSDPFGWFRPGQSAAGEGSVFIATGTGIAPFLSFLRSGPDRSPLACFYGVRHEAEAFAPTELEAVPDFRLAVSRETANGHFHGRVTGLLEGIPLDPETHYYLCGLDAMITEVSLWLEDQGVEYTQIHREVFFYADEDR